MAINYSRVHLLNRLGDQWNEWNCLSPMALRYLEWSVLHHWSKVVVAFDG